MMELTAIEAEIEKMEQRKARLSKLLKLREEVSELELNAMAGTDALWTIRLIAEETCRNYSLSFEELTSPSRNVEVCIPRMIIFYLAREIRCIPYAKIGKAFQKDHGTIISGCRRIQGLADTDHKFADRLSELKASSIAKIEAALKERNYETQKAN